MPNFIAVTSGQLFAWHIMRGKSAGAMYCQYQMFISPDTVGGISVSSQRVFAPVVGGIHVLPGPTLGTDHHPARRRSSNFGTRALA
jgi:hypothetical protein